MKKRNVTFEGTTDTTGYLFSLMKSLHASLWCSRYRDRADDIVASSGFAFRMWVDPKGLCPSATSIWDFQMQKPWVENGGLACGYVQRLWGEDAVEESRRAEAAELIKNSIDDGIAPVAWDISGCEWGLITGYDGDTLFTRKIDGSEDSIPCEKLGRLELPILSVLAVTGRTEKPAQQIVTDTKKLAVSHLRGEEWCENAQGLAAYDALTGFIDTRLSDDTAWNLEYYLGTYAALKWYAWKFFEKYNEPSLADIYKTVYASWKTAFDLKLSRGIGDQAKAQIIDLLQTAKQAEARAVEIMSA